MHLPIWMESAISFEFCGLVANKKGTSWCRSFGSKLCVLGQQLEEGELQACPPEDFIWELQGCCGS